MKALARRTPQWHRVTFLDPDQLEVVVLAKLGRSDLNIQELTGLSPSKIRYMLRKAHKLEGFAPGETYRRQWRDGTSAEARVVWDHMHARIQREAGRYLPARIDAVLR